MVSGFQRQRIQKRLEQFLTDTCLIEAETSTVDNYGSPVHTWSTVAADVPCRVIKVGQRNRGAAAEVGGQEVIVELYKLICAKGTALDVDQRVTINGLVYQVVDVITAWTDSVDAQAIITRARGG